MTEQQISLFKKYKAIRNEIDSKYNELSSEHHDYMNCKKGCSSCCMNFSVLPIEYDFITNHIQDFDNKRIQITENEDSCAFLDNQNCLIYEHRPIICRTHGLPLLFMDEEGVNWQLSFCELNFEDFDLDEFSEENTYPQDVYNSKLYMLNKEYIEVIGKYDSIQLVDMKTGK